MKRTKQAEKMINAVNEYLKNNNIKNQNDCVFAMFLYALLKADIYDGYGFFKRKQIEDQELLVIVQNQEQSDCLQFL